MARSWTARVWCACIAGAAVLLLAAGPASAGTRSRGGPPVVSAPLADGLLGPLQMEVTPRGDAVVVQSFGAKVTLVSKSGGTTDLFDSPGADGVALGPWGTMLTTKTVRPDGPPLPGGPDAATVEIRSWAGATRTLADLWAYEQANNPDGGQNYGFFGLSSECAASLPPDMGLLPAPGGLDSHPYALARTRSGVYVADAGANAIFFVDWWGRIRTVAVLPAQPPVTVTAEAAAANHLPPCVVGASYVAEPVPTDVEIGPRGMLYVSTLPGGPEDASLGARGGVYRINPWTGNTRRLATGFLGATNVAVSDRGTVYVSEMFGNRISKIVHGHAVKVVDVSTPSALEWHCGQLYAAIDSLPPEEGPPAGKIVTIRP